MKKQIKISDRLAEDLGLGSHQRNGYTAVYTHIFTYDEEQRNRENLRLNDKVEKEIQDERENEEQRIIGIIQKIQPEIRAYRSYNKRGTCVYLRITENESMMGEWDEEDRISLKIREECKEAIEDYIESCHRQGIDLSGKEKKRFMRENNHMNLSEAEIEYIERYEV